MKLFVWDFYGTLERGNELAVREVSNTVLNEFCYEKHFTEQDCHTLYGKHWWEYFAHLLPEEPHERHLELEEAAFTLSNSQPDIIARHIQPNEHAHDVLAQILHQILISHTRPESLGIFRDAVGMHGYFPQTFASKTKQDILRRYLQEKSFDHIVVIGDSPHDVALVAVAGGVSYLYSHPGKPFRDCPADYHIRDLRDVLREI